MSDKGELTQIVLPITGMHCASCVSTIEQSLLGVSGVKSVSVNYVTSQAAITLSTALTSRADLAEAVRRQGYDVATREKQITVTIEGMHCASCTQTIEKALISMDGVLEASVNLATSRGQIRYDPTQLRFSEIQEIIARAGYAVLRFEETLQEGTLGIEQHIGAWSSPGSSLFPSSSG